MRRCCVRISLCEDGSFEVVTVVESLGPITTMGASGRHSANPSHSELLILPGADMWDTGGRRGVRRRRAHCRCGRTGGLHLRRHSGTRPRRAA